LASIVGVSNAFGVKRTPRQPDCTAATTPGFNPLAPRQRQGLASGGNGLGLPAALGIVRGHAGAIAVESAAGKGTSVRVLLPAAPVGTELARS